MVPSNPDFEGLRRSVEARVDPPPFGAIRERRRRRQQRRAVASSLAVVLVAGVVGAGLVRDHKSPTTAKPDAPTRVALDRVALGDRLPPPADYKQYVVTDIDFVDETTGWAIGLRCVGDACDVATWRTDDGGASWGKEVRVATGVPRVTFRDEDPSGGGARSLRMVDAYEGFAFNPDLYVTHDGGASWHRVPQPSKVASVQVTGRSAWLVERGCPIATDCALAVRSGAIGAGFTLSPVRLPATRGAKALLRRPDRHRAYLLTWGATGAAPLLRRSVDGGATWIAGPDPCGDADSQLLSAAAGRPLWLVCTTGVDESARTSAKRVFTSPDYGVTWRRVADLPPTGVTSDLVSVSSSTVYVTTSVRGRIYLTSDGGATWRIAQGIERKRYGYGNVDAVDPAHVWAMGDAGVLWRTTDGAVWRSLALPPAAPRASATPKAGTSPAPRDTDVAFSSLSFLDPQHGRALGRRCVAHRCRLVLRVTSDGGRTWRRAYAPPAVWPEGEPGVAGVVFATATDGWLVGDKAYATHDGGTTWQRRPALAGVTAVTVAGDAVWGLEYEGCAGTPCNPQPVRWPVTTDVRADLARVPERAPGGTGALAAVDATHAYVVTSGGDEPPAVSATTNGGATWHTVPAPCPTARAWEISAPAADDLWIACGGEPGAGNQQHAVSHSTDGGAHWRTAFTTESAGYLDTLRAFSPLDAWRSDGGGGGALRSTHDGGRTWSVAEPGDGSYAALALVFTDPEHGWALYSEDGVYRTTDGETWQLLGRP